MKYIVFLCLLAACLNPSERSNRKEIVLSMAKTLDKQYPGIPSITALELQPDFLLVDAREQNERNISMIPTAISMDQLSAIDTANKKVIVYDTIGTRSQVIVSELRAKGVDAYNLFGGVLAYSHLVGTFVNPDGQQTKRVHVYAEAWDMLPDGFEAITQ